jgi:hypothetical protein
MCLDDLLFDGGRAERVEYMKRVQHALKWGAVLLVVAIAVVVSDR